MCDRVALMHLGTIRADGSPDELNAAARAGRDARGRVPALRPATRSTARRSGREGSVRSAALAGLPAASAERAAAAPRSGARSRAASRRSASSSCRSSATTAPSSSPAPFSPCCGSSSSARPSTASTRSRPGATRTSTSSRRGSSPSRGCSSRSSTGSRSSGSATPASSTKLLVTPTPRVRADPRQVVLGRHPRARPGRRRARPVGDPRRLADAEPAAISCDVRRRHARRGVLLRACR